ncbi:MAG: hypothetical protein U1A27_05945 [Phycisphaerae bacterium]
MGLSHTSKLALAGLFSAGAIGGAAVPFVRARTSVVSLMTALNESSERAADTARYLSGMCVPADKRDRAHAELADLEQRVNELLSPAKVVANLSETCRKAGDVVLEVAPAPMANNQHPSAADVNRRFKLVVSGTYRQVASLLDECSRQRLPARVIEFQIAPIAAESGSGQLRAEIIVECFRLASDDPGAKGPA